MKTASVPIAAISVLTIALAVPALADFSYLKSIPAPDIPCFEDDLTGLDRTESAIVVTARYQAVGGSGGASWVFLVDPADGNVLRGEPVPAGPALCARDYWQLGSCACAEPPDGVLNGPAAFWAADICGEIALCGFGDGIEIGERFKLDGAPRPVSMATGGDSLFVLDGDNHWIIARYFLGAECRTDTIDLHGGPDAPSALTIWRGNFLVSGSPQRSGSQFLLSWEYPLWEFDREGELVATHLLRSPRRAPPKNITVLEDLLYVAAYSDSLLVFEPAGLGINVPAGDSVVVVAVPGELEVVFDSVSTPGQLFCSVLEADSCPPPEGVGFFSEFYEVSTTARFDYAAQVVIKLGDAPPEGVDVEDLRVFSRPSGHCREYLDITTEPAEIVEEFGILRVLTRTKSEDDEFSVFTLGEELRSPMEVIELKLENLEAAIDACQDSVPGPVLAEILRLLDDTRREYHRGRSGLAADKSDSIAALVRSTPEIPHTYDPDIAGRNMAGRLISDAHTLAFSLRFSEGEAVETSAVVIPDRVRRSDDGWVRVYLELPDRFEPAPEVSDRYVFLGHLVRAVPESVAVGDYLGGEGQQIKAVFCLADIEAALSPISTRPLRITCFVDGYEVYAEVDAVGLTAVPADIIEGPLVAGSTHRLDWGESACGALAGVSVWWSSDGGAAWHLVAEDLAGPYLDWEVPDAITDRARLKITCSASDGSPVEIVSEEFVIAGAAGVEASGSGLEPALTVKPNPSASAFVLEVASDGARPVDVRIYSVSGLLVKTLCPEGTSAGALSLVWRGDSDDGSRVSPGTYFAVVKVGERTSVRKLVLQR